MCILADVACVDEMEWGMYIRDDCSPQGAMLQLRPQSQCHLRSSATSAVVFLKRVHALILQCRNAFFDSANWSEGHFHSPVLFVVIPDH